MADGALSAGTISLAVKPDTSTFAAKLKGGITAGTRGVGEHMGGMIKNGLAAMAGPIGAVTAAFGVEKLITGSVDAFENLATSVNQIKRVTGGTTEQVSGMRAAMQLAGVDVNNISSSMTIFSKNMAKAGTDATKTAAMNQLFGQSIKDAHGNIKPMAELLPGLADKFKAMPNGAEKTALATQLFGRSGAQLIPVLNKGSAGIQELTDKAKGMGLVLDDKATAAVAKNKAEQREFQATLQGLSVTIGQALMPIMEAMASTFRDVIAPLIQKVTAWVKSHQAAFEELGKKIKGFVMPIFNNVIGVIKNLVNWIISNRDWLIAIGIAVLTFVGIMKGYQLAITIATVAQKAWAVAQGIFKIVTGAATAEQLGFNAALLANPIVLIVALVAALVAGLIWFFTQTKLGQQIWKGFGDFIGSVVKNIGKWFAGLWTSVVNVFKGLGKFIGGVFGFVGGLFKGYINFWITIFESFINFFVNGINGILGGINLALAGVKAITGGAIDLKIGKIPNVTLPRLAQGGIVPATPGGRQVTVAEAGQAEAIIPLSKLAQMVPGAGGNRPIYADGIGLIGFMKTTAKGEARIVFDHELGKVMKGTR
jgi:phage-related protein